MKSEIAGLLALEEHQKGELDKIDSELEQLTGNRSRFDRLELELTQAKDASEQYSALAIKEELGAEVGKQGLSTIEIAQAALDQIKRQGY